jgi:hypothetical protein
VNANGRARISHSAGRGAWGVGRGAWEASVLKNCLKQENGFIQKVVNNA